MTRHYSTGGAPIGSAPEPEATSSRPLGHNRTVRPLPPAVLRLWRLTSLATAATVGVVGLGIELGLRRQFSLPLPPGMVALSLAAIVAAVGWVAATVRYRRWAFELTDEWIQARWGVVGRYSATIPRNRVQTMTTRNGPIDRLLDLTSVTVHTAGAGAPNLLIPHLDSPTVEWLRSELARGRLPG